MPGFEQLRDAYLSWPSLARDALEESSRVSREAPGAYSCVDEVVACGVGGSGVVGEYLAKLSEYYGGVPVSVVRGMVAPRRVGRRTLVLGVSFSGSTIETIRCVESAARHGAKIAVVTGKGQLYERARANGWLTVTVPQGPAARSMFASLFYSALGLLNNLGLLSIPGSEVEQSIVALADVNIEDRAKSLAEKLQGRRLILVASGYALSPLSLRTAQELAENAKKMAVPLYAPEALHNFIEGVRSIEALEGVAVVAYKWPGYTGKPLYEHLVKILSQAGETHEVEVSQPGLLQALAWGTLLAGLMTIHLAKLEGIDPLEIPRIKEARRIASQL